MPNSVKLFGKTNSVRLLQPLKASDPISFSPSEKLMETKFSQFLKASDLIEVTVPGMSMCVRDVRPAKALSPISVTDDGIFVLFYQCISSSLYNGIAIISAVIDGIVAIYNNRFQRTAAKDMISNFLNTTGNIDVF